MRGGWQRTEGNAQPTVNAARVSVTLNGLHADSQILLAAKQPSGTQASLQRTNLERHAADTDARYGTLISNLRLRDRALQSVFYVQGWKHIYANCAPAL